MPKGASECGERLMLEVGLLKPWMLRMFGKPWFPRYIDYVEHRTAPGLSLHVGLRKRFLDDEVRAAIAEGATQIVMVGAGYDTLCVRLASEHSEVLFVEVDHPATHAVKRAAVEGAGASVPNLHLCAADLGSQGLGDVLGGLEAWSSSAITVVVAEGVLMYLDEAAVSTFLHAVHDNLPAGSQLLFTHMLADDKGEVILGERGWLVRFGAKLAGEQLRWGIREQDLPAFLERHGLRYLPDADRFNLRRRYLEPAGLGGSDLSDLERVASARVT